MAQQESEVFVVVVFQHERLRKRPWKARESPVAEL